MREIELSGRSTRIQHVDNFSDLFCDAARNAPDFNSSIQELFSEFEGEFTDEALEEIHTNYGFHTGTNFDYGKITKMEWSNKYINMNTNSGESYVFYVARYFVNDEYPQYNGVTAFTMKHTNEEEKRVGFITKSI